MTKGGLDSNQDRSSSRVRTVNVPWPKVFLAIAVVATVVGAVVATKTLARIEKGFAEAKESARPANLKLTKINAPGCSDCFNVDEAIGTVKKQNVSIGEEKTLVYDSSEAQSLIKQYGITKIPSYILTGEVTKKALEAFVRDNGEIKNDAFVFTKVTPVYLDPETKKELGRVTASYLVDPSCPQCLNPKAAAESFKKSGVQIVAERELAWDSPEGRQLISQYKITKIPTFIFSSDVDVYDSVRSSWQGIGTIEQDKTYVARSLYLPYRDLERGQILGLVDVVYITDSTCSNCYDPLKIQKPILTQGYGVGLRSERTVDVNSAQGRNLVSQYKITKIPTILLSPDVDQYTNLKKVWSSVGTVEENGWYVFREMAELESVTYKDLSTGQVIQPTAQTGGQP